MNTTFGGMAVAILMDLTLSENPDQLRPSLTKRVDAIFAQHGVQQSATSRQKIQELEALFHAVHARLDG